MDGEDTMSTTHRQEALNSNHPDLSGRHETRPKTDAYNFTRNSCVTVLETPRVSFRVHALALTFLLRLS